MGSGAGKRARNVHITGYGARKPCISRVKDPETMKMRNLASLVMIAALASPMLQAERSERYAPAACSWQAHPSETSVLAAPRLLVESIGTYLSNRFPISSGDVSVKKLGRPGFNGGLVIAPDESYMVVSANRTRHFASQFYISFRKADVSWKVSVSLGLKVKDGQPHHWGMALWTAGFPGDSDLPA
jgi:hypothetical protein